MPVGFDVALYINSLSERSFMGSLSQELSQSVILRSAQLRKLRAPMITMMKSLNPPKIWHLPPLSVWMLPLPGRQRTKMT